ncbi:MAG: metallophosphoesterase [Hyphomicrobium sp.]
MLKWMAGLGVSGAALGGYALAEPFRLNVTRYRIAPSGWPPGLNLKLAIIADLHACNPWMPIDRVEQIVRRANAVEPDAVLLLGDYVASMRMSKLSSPMPHREWSSALAKLNAPLGVHAVLGNHDWWEHIAVQRARKGPTAAGRALEDSGIAVYENKAVRLKKDGRPFWIAGLGDQWAFWPKAEDYERFRRAGKRDYEGVDDLAGTLRQVTDNAPVILMAHEPDIFPDVPARVALTLSGHTHGGQVRLGGFAPIVPSKFGRRYVYGHIVEDGRNLLVSGGLGCSGIPVRFGSPPEIVVVELGTGAVGS